MAHTYEFEIFTPAGALAARIFRDVADLTSPRPTVVVTGLWLTVKEQMPDLYAARLADDGFTAVTFDFSGFGASAGEPRQAELPERKVGEIAAVAQALASLSFVSGAAVGHLGVCASAQYTLKALQRSTPIAAFVSVAGWFHDAATVAPLYGDTAGVAQRLERGQDALGEFQRDGTVRTVPAYADGDQRAGMFLPLPYYGEPGRGAVPTWRNEMAELSWLYWLTFDGVSGAADVTTPTLFVHSDDCVLPDNVRAVAAAMPSAQLTWGEGGQIDFYDQPAQVDFAVAAAVGHFRPHLPEAA